MSALNIEPNSQANVAGVPPAPPEDSSNRQGVKTPFRWVPRDYMPVELVGAPDGAQVFAREDGCAAIAYSGRRGKHDWHHSFSGSERLHAFVAKWVAGLVRADEWRCQRRAERKAAGAAGHGCKVGDIFRCCWGYDQTNVDYYQVTALHGRTMATVRRIAAQAQETARLQGECAPAPGHFLDADRYPPMRVKLNPGATPSFKAYSFASAYLVKPIVELAGVKSYAVDHWTAYA